jgi:hypothetical protein
MLDQRGDLGADRWASGPAGDLVPQHQQFRIFRRRRAAEQDQPAADTDEDEIEQAQGHGRSSWPIADPWRIAAAHGTGRLLAPPQASWAGRTRLDNQSGTRTGRAKSKKGNGYLAGLLGETAVAADRTQTREGARYRRLARKRGKLKAQVAVGNTQLKVYHKLLSSPGMRYQDLGPDYYERRADSRRQIAHHVGKLGSLGFEVTLVRIPDPEPDGPGQTQAA